MKCWPPLEVLLIGSAWLLILIPLRAVTSREPAPEIKVEPGMTGSEPLVKVFLEIRTVDPPQSVTIYHLGKPVWELNGQSEKETEFSDEARLRIPAEGIDLRVVARFSKGAKRTALELTLEPEAMDTRKATVWGDREIDEVATFLW